MKNKNKIKLASYTSVPSGLILSSCLFSKVDNNYLKTYLVVSVGIVFITTLRISILELLNYEK